MEKQKAAGRAAGKFRMDRALEYGGSGNRFTGYEVLEQPAKVLATYVVEKGKPLATPAK